MVLVLGTVHYNRLLHNIMTFTQSRNFDVHIKMFTNTKHNFYEPDALLGNGVFSSSVTV